MGSQETSEQDQGQRGLSGDGAHLGGSQVEGAL